MGLWTRDVGKLVVGDIFLAFCALMMSLFVYRFLVCIHRFYNVPTFSFLVQMLFCIDKSICSQNFKTLFCTIDDHFGFRDNDIRIIGAPCLCVFLFIAFAGMDWVTR